MKGRADTPEAKRVVIERLLSAWLKTPEQRLGQFLVNALNDEVGSRVFYVEDEALADAAAALSHRSECGHGVTFDELASGNLGPHEVRKRWPRLFGECPKGCGFNGIAYASYVHYIAGDW